MRYAKQWTFILKLSLIGVLIYMTRLYPTLKELHHKYMHQRTMRNVVLQKQQG